LPTHLLQPPAEHYWTGGYLYNKQLTGSSHIKLASLELDDIAASLAAGELRDDLLIFDSLYLYQADFARHWQSFRPAFLLIHHLQSCDESLPIDLRRAFAEFEKQILKDAKGLIVTSLHMAVRMQKIFPDMRIICCSPGVDAEKVTELRLARSRFLKMSLSGPIRLLSVGHITSRKGFIEGAELLSKLKYLHRTVNWQWLIIGSEQADRKYARKFRQILQESHLHDQVTFLGLQSPQQVLSWMSQVDILFFPSLFETYGMVVLEALSMGLPVIANKQGEMSQLLEQSANGLLYSQGELTASLAAIAALLENRSRLVEMSLHLLSHYPLRSWQQVAKNLGIALLAN